MTLSGRLALAMVLLVGVTACIVGGLGWYFLHDALGTHAAAIGYAVLAGGAVAAVLALALASVLAQSLSGPLTQQALLEHAVRSISDPVLVVDAKGKIVVANAAARRLLGVDLSIVVRSNPFRYFLPDGMTRARPEESPLARALQGEDVDDVEYIAEAKATGVRENLAVTARPLRDEAGHLCGAVGVVRNVTAQRRAYRALIDSEQMAQSIVDSALDAFVQTDETCRVLDWSPNAEALVGWTRAEAVGKAVDDLVFPQAQRAVHRQWVARFLSEASGDATGGRYETPLLHKDGHEFFAEVSLTALRRGGGYIINAFVRDITAKRAAEEQLFQAQKMESVGQLTGGIAHDFNNVLTVITGTIEILADGVRDNPALASIVKMIDDASNRAAQLTANLLSFARKQPLRPVETDVNALVEEVVQLLSPTLGRQVEIETIFGEQAWPALVDRSQLSSALVNLAINGRDAMPDGGRLVLRTSNASFDAQEAEANGLGQGDYVVIDVTDSGAGIPAAIQGRIFEPFFSTKQFGSGSGLGLSMVFGFAKQSGGNIVVRSEEGKGATFRIYLPKADNTASPQIAAVADEEMRGGTETILCVEDDDFVRDLVTVRLRSLGYTVIAASDATKALELVNAGTAFDLLFTDIVMPGGINGRQLAEKVAELRPPLRVLYTSGNTFGAFNSDGGMRWGVLLLAKPYRKAELARMVRLSLDREIDHMGDPIPTPYSVQEDLARFLKENPRKE